MLEYFCCDRESCTLKYDKRVFHEIGQKAWTETKREYIKDCIVWVGNMPSVPVENRSDFISWFHIFLDEISTVVKGSIYLAVDTEKNATKSWCFVEFESQDIINQVITKLSKKFKVPSHFGAVWPAASKKNKQLQAKRFKELETAKDPNLIEYLRHFLYSDETKSITTTCKDLLTEVFIQYASSINGVLGPDDLDKLQMITQGEPFGAENIEYTLKNYETKTVKRMVIPKKIQKKDEMEIDQKTTEDEDKEKVDKEEEIQSKEGQDDMEIVEEKEEEMEVEAEVEVDITGITLNGFLMLYTGQCDTEPIETFDEFLKLGYDLHLIKNHYLSLDTALKVLELFREKSHNFLIYESIVNYADLIFTRVREFSKPVQLNVAHLIPIAAHSGLANKYPLLADMDPRLLRLNFEILRQFNSKLGTVLPLINLEGNSSLVRYLYQCHGLIFHSTKIEFIYDVLDKTAVQGNQPTVSYNRLKLASRLEKHDPKAQVTDEMMLKNTAFGLAFSQLRHTDPELYRQKKPPGTEPHVSLLMDFKGEHVEGEGGPYRQFFTDVSKELKDNSLLPLLIPCPNAQAKIGKNKEKYIIAPSMKKRIHMRMFRFLGQLMGMSIRTGVLLTLDLPASVWKPLVGAELVRDDLKAIDHSFVSSLEYFEACNQEGFESAFDIKYTTKLSDKSTCLLKKNGDKIDVTFDNLKEYVRLAEKARQNESKLQLKSIRTGLADVIPLPLLNLLTWQDLEWRVCGKPEIDIQLLKRHTEYSTGLSPNALHITYFWQVLESLDQEDRRAFVQFSWGQERLPANDQEFERTSTRLLIKPYQATTDPDQLLPKVDTCFFNIMLPEYTNPEILKERLLFAIHFDADSMNADAPQDGDGNNRRLGFLEFQ